MARDAAGVYTLPLSAVTTGTVISATWANTTLDDIETELTDSLDRYGRGGMSVAYENLDGTLIAPGITFNADTTIGFRRSATNVMNAVVEGVDVAKWIDATATGAGSQRPFQVWDGSAWFSPLNEAQMANSVTFGTVTSSAAVTLFNSLAVTTGGINVDAGGVTVAGDLNVTGNLTGSLSVPIPAFVSAYVTSTGSLSANIGIATASRTSVGRYLLTLDTNWTDPSNPVAMANPVGSVATTANCLRVGANQIEVRTFDLSTGTYLDSDFMFFGVN